jgi:hypothetical protein
MAKDWKDIDDNTTVTGELEVYTKEYSMYDLWIQAWQKAGMSLFYMQFIHPKTDFGSQQQRVENMCYHLASEQRNHFKDTPENRKWFADWMEKFEDEVENQC